MDETEQKVMLEYLPQAITSLSTAGTIARAMLELRDFEKLNGKVIELQQCIIAAQSQVLAGQSEQSALTTKVKELEQECMRLKDWSAERSNYACKQIGPGVFAYIQKDLVGEVHANEKFCSNCFDKSIKSRLQQNMALGIRSIHLVCPNGCPEIVFPHYVPV
jgi:hypothetical protein